MEPSAADMIWDDPFDSIDDLLDFPNDDDVLAVLEACGCGGGGAVLPPPQAPEMSSAGSAAAGEIHDHPCANSDGFKEESDALGLCSDIDITNLEWLSNFFEDSEFNFDFPATAGAGAGAGATTNIPNNKDDSLFRSLSPISVLELNSLCGGGGTATMGGGSGAYSSSTTSSCSSSNSIGDRSTTARPPPPPAPIPARARTKRPRPPCFSARSFVPPPSSDYPSAISYSARPAEPAEPESVGESYPVAMKKKRKKNVFYVPERGQEDKWAEGSVRKCMHCEIQKTPQWRAGPMGPKTLCNACGVRYKSGRLFPEYRPAASPTFVPSIHSNSHKKVVEMRLMSNETAAGDVGMRPQEGTVAAKNCDLLKYIRRQD